MSTTRNQRSTNTAAAAKKFCGICKAVGKSEEEYTNHYTKSAAGPKGVVTCPLILSSVCKCCSKQGHFADHCPKRAEKKNQTVNVEIRMKPAAAAVHKKSNPIAASRLSSTKSSLSSTNRFNLLRDLEDDDELVSAISTPSKKTFASVLASNPMKSALSDKSNTSSFAQAPIQLSKVATRPRRSWADTTDSDTEDEDDFE